MYYMCVYYNSYWRLDQNTVNYEELCIFSSSIKHKNCTLHNCYNACVTDFHKQYKSQWSTVAPKAVQTDVGSVYSIQTMHVKSGQLFVWAESTWHAVGMVDRCSYSGQQNDTVSWVCGRRWMIWSQLMADFDWFLCWWVAKARNNRVQQY